METTKQQAVLLALLEALKDHDSWCGETHIQKCTYFLQEALGVPLGFEFVLYKHGPFSFDLRSFLGDVRANLLIDVKSKYPYGPSLEPSESGKVQVQRLSGIVDRYARQIEFVADNLGARDVVELERLGTALYVTKQEQFLSREERATRITQLKPHIKYTSALTAIDEIDLIIAEASGCLSRT